MNYDAIIIGRIMNITSPEVQVISGYVYADKKDRFTDGAHIRTSLIRGIDGDIVITMNTRYKFVDLDKIAKSTEPVLTRKSPKGPQEYKGNGNHQWEAVCPGESRAEYSTYRLRVPGGWLYRTGKCGDPTFVPVPEAVGYKV